MKTYRIYGSLGLIGIFEALTSDFALDEMCKFSGFSSFDEMALEFSGKKSDFEVLCMN